MSGSGGDDKPPFIVIEGLDGVGTTTQCEALVERLRDNDVDVSLTREPSDGPIGSLIHQILADRVVVPRNGGNSRPVDGDALALLFAADRLDHVDAEIEPALRAGRVVVSDRYYHSSLVYQGEETDQDFDMSWIERLNARARRPDLTIFLRAPAQVCLDRLEVRETRSRYESAEKLERFEERYEHVIQVLRERGERIETIDATRSIEQVHSDIYAAVESVRADS